MGASIQTGIRIEPAREGVAMINFARRAIKYVAEFAKKNSGALIIGVSLIIGLNFERFANYFIEIPDAFRLAIYHLSGQADADRKAQQQYYAEQKATREREARELQERLAREAHERAKQAKERAAQRELERQQEEAQRAKEAQARRAEKAAWQEFLTANRAKFKQIELVKDSQHGDYNCLRIRQVKWDFVSVYAPETEKIAAEQKAEVSTYQVRDSISDDFVQWLRNNKVSDRADWKYEDLQNMPTDYKGFGCWSPKKVWRANRDQ
jgi:hypothetical protein